MVLSGGDFILSDFATSGQKEFRNELKTVVDKLLGLYTVIRHPVHKEDASYCSGIWFPSRYRLCEPGVAGRHYNYILVALPGLW